MMGEFPVSLNKVKGLNTSQIVSDVIAVKELITTQPNGYDFTWTFDVELFEIGP